MISEDFPIRWSKDRHDSRADDDAHRRQKEKESIARRRILRMYEDWRKSLLKRKPRRDELMESVRKLSNNIALEAKGCDGLKEFVDYTIRLLDSKVIELSSMTALNKITKHEPDGSPLDIPSIAPFSTRDELDRITWVKAWTEKPGFVGFVIEEGRLFALSSSNDGLEVDLVGTLDNRFGVAEIPSLEAMKKELARK